jgi:hypothetical protein
MSASSTLTLVAHNFSAALCAPASTAIDRNHTLGSARCTTDSGSGASGGHALSKDAVVSSPDVDCAPCTHEGSASTERLALQDLLDDGEECGDGHSASRK